MTRHTKIRRIDVTARQTNKIEFLKRQVNDAETVLAKATSKYDSFVTKAELFTALYAEAEVDQQTAESYWKTFLQVKSDLKALNSTADEANLVGVDAFHDVRQLILAWEQVTTDTLKAAEVIVLAAEYIDKRKASNPLISSELVSAATAAVKTTEKTVKAVISAFTDALSTLSSSAQANNSTELTSVYIQLAMTALLERNGVSPLLSLTLSDKNMDLLKAKEKKILELTKADVALETSLSTALKAAKMKTQAALTASESANKEMNKAKEEMAQAEAALSTWEAALTAAETAVAG